MSQQAAGVTNIDSSGTRHGAGPCIGLLQSRTSGVLVSQFN